MTKLDKPRGASATIAALAAPAPADNTFLGLYGRACKRCGSKQHKTPDCPAPNKPTPIDRPRPARTPKSTPPPPASAEEVAKMRGELDAVIAIVGGRARADEATIAELAAARVRIAELTAQIEAVQARANVSISNADELCRALEATTTQNEALEKQLGAAVSELGGARASAHQARADLEAMRGSRDDLAAMLEKAGEDRDAVKAEHAQLAEELDNARVRLVEDDREIADLRRRLAETQKQRDAARAEHDALAMKSLAATYAPASDAAPPAVAPASDVTTKAARAWKALAREMKERWVIARRQLAPQKPKLPAALIVAERKEKKRLLDGEYERRLEAQAAEDRRREQDEELAELLAARGSKTKVEDLEDEERQGLLDELAQARAEAEAVAPKRRATARHVFRKRK